MKHCKLLLLAAMLLSGATLHAQSAAGAMIEKDYHLFDFTLNASRMEAGITVGQVASFSDRARFGVGAYAMFNGFYLDFIKAEPQHKYYSHVTNEKWNDDSAFGINAGYQIPVVSWLRIMPLVGYFQTNDGITDGTSIHMSIGDETTTWYHDYDVTPGSRAHYFNYGGGLSIQPCKWFSINLIATTHALYGGIGLDIISFIRRKQQ